MTTEKQNWIKIIYLYLFSLVGLMLIVIGSVQLIDLALKTFIFTKADEPLIYPQPYPPANEQTDKKQRALEEKERYEQQQIEYERKLRQQQKQRTMANSIAMIIVGLPLFLYHWGIIRREERKN